MAVRTVVINRTADVISILHALIVLVAALGWWLPEEYQSAHFVILFATWVSWVWYGSCILAEVEYRVRKHADPALRPYSKGYLHYHLRHLGDLAPSYRFIRVVGLCYLSLAIVLWIIRAWLIT